MNDVLETWIESCRISTLDVVLNTVIWRSVDSHGWDARCRHDPVAMVGSLLFSNTVCGWKWGN